jgi:peroxiredoxin
MAALKTGTLAPDFTLPAIDGKPFSLKEALVRGPVVVAFFKVSCPVCQFAFPYLERIYQSYGKRNVTMVGISQNQNEDTVAFLREYGVSFPVLLDDPTQYLVSNAYGLTNVPSIFWIAQDGDIEISSVGWVRNEIAEIGRMAAESTGGGAKPVFRPGEDVPDFRPG